MIPLTLYSWNPRAMCKQRKYHAVSTEGIGISWMVGGSVRLKRLTLHFSGGWGCLRKQSHPWGKYGYE